MKDLKALITYLSLFILLLFQASLQADSLDEQFVKANTAYENKAYEEAIQAYDKILDEGKASAYLYYNLGNAHYKMGNVAESILNYERALRINPRYEDAAYNLKMANLKVIDNIDPLPQLMFISWADNFYKGLSSQQWAYVSIVLFWLAFFAAAAFLLVNNSMVKRIGFFGGIVLLLFGLIGTALSFQRQDAELNTEFGIISQSTAYIKNAPNGDQDLLVLHEGAKVEIMEKSGNWSKVYIKGVGIDVVGFVKATEVTGI
ncbi:MAG: tetratricopeptide repeat protein [Bacteroidota bacterium]